MDNQKVPYVCGPLTELTPERQVEVKKFYQDIADLCAKVLGARAFVPHEHYDPKIHASFTPREVDEAERKQVCEKTSVLIVFTEAPSWGGGIEVEMAYRSNVPIILLCEKKRLEERKISRLLRGNPGIVATLVYESFNQALALLEAALLKL